jgi:hypothetical protein
MFSTTNLRLVGYLVLVIHTTGPDEVEATSSKEK